MLTRQVEPGEPGCRRQHGQVAAKGARVQVQAPKAAGGTRHQLAQQAIAVGRLQRGARQLQLLQVRQRAPAHRTELCREGLKRTIAMHSPEMARQSKKLPKGTAFPHIPDLQPHRLLGRVVRSTQRAVHHAELPQRGQRRRRVHLQEAGGGEPLRVWHSTRRLACGIQVRSHAAAQRLCGHQVPCTTPDK